MYTQYTKQNTKTLMIEKAIELFRERGSDNVSVKDICDSASVTRNAFYYHFENKDLLFDAVGDWVSSISKQRVRIIYGGTSFYQQMWEFYKAYLLTEIELGADIMNHVCFSRTMKGQADRYSYIDANLAVTMKELIGSAQREGQILNSSPPEALLWTSYATIRGINIKWCFQFGEIDLIKEAMQSLNTLFMPVNGFELI